MERTKKLLTIIVEICALAALVVGMVLLLRLRSASTETGASAPQQPYLAPATQDVTQAPVLRPEMPVQAYPVPGQAPTPEATRVVIKSPTCAFPGSEAVPAQSEGSIDRYEFSQPRVVFTNDKAIGIAGWLPDGERLLLTRDMQNNLESIEILDLRTGAVQVYAERSGGNGKPVWLEELQAVVYSTDVKDHQELWISYGDPQKAGPISPDVFALSLASDGNEVIFFSPGVGDQPQIWDATSKTSRAAAVDLRDRAYSRYGEIDRFQPIPGATFQIALQPGGEKAAFYGHALLFLADLQSGEVCEVDLGADGSGPRSAWQTQWSADGRYLAMNTWSGYPGTIHPYSQILVLDTLTGERYVPEMDAPFVYDLTWSLANHTLAILGKVDTIDGRAKMGLFLIDINGKAVRHFFPEQFFGGGDRGLVAWSKDKIAVDCTSWPQTSDEMAEGRVCIIDVSQKP